MFSGFVSLIPANRHVVTGLPEGPCRQRTVPPPGNRAATCPPRILPVSSWSSVTVQIGELYWPRSSEIEGIAAIHDHPAKSCSDSRPRHLRKGSVAGRFQNQGIHAGRPGLYHLEKLPALLNGVVVRVENLRIDVQSTGRLAERNAPALADNRFLA